MDTDFLKKVVRFCLFGIALCGGIFHAAADPVPFLSPTNFWKYNDESIDLGTGWIATNYNDSAWSNGLSTLGFRSLNNTNYALPPPNYIHTLVRKITPTNAARNIMTFYFRTHFTFTNDPGGMTLTASNLIDDGAIFYMNGRELTRVAMQGGPIAWDTAATRGDLIGTNRVPTVGTHGYDVFSVPIDMLVQGDNLVAVEVHQASTSSSAMAFQMELWAEFPAATQLSITNDIEDITVEEGRPASFQVGVSGAGGRYQWYRQGVGPIPGAIVDTYSVAAVSTNDSDFYYVVVTNIINAVTSRLARLTVLVDASPPRLEEANGSLTTTNVLVSFSESLLPSTATNLANYKVTNTFGGTLAVTRAVLTNATNVLLTTSAARLPNNNYILIANGIRDSSPRTNMVLTNSMIPISNLATILGLSDGGWRFYDPFPPFDAPNLGTAWRELAYTETNDWADGTSVFFNGIDPTTIPGPVNTLLSQTPTVTSYFRYTFPSLQIASGSQRLFFTHIIDDGVVLYLNGNEIFRTNLPAGGVNYQTKATVNVGSPSRVGPISMLVPFLPGTNVIAAELHMFGPATNKAFGIQLDAYVRSVPAGPVIITAGPENLTVFEGQTATFQAIHAGGVTFQWQQNNVDIVGARGDIYSRPAVPLSLNGTQFRVIVTGAGNSVTSTNATLRVLPDTNAPALVAAFASLNSILVSFSENVSAATATATGNYLVTNSAGQSFTVTGASLVNGTNVALSFATLPANAYFVVVSNVRDTSIAGNLIAPNSTVKAGFDADVISITDSWRYNQRTNDLTSQGWTARTYNDTAWTGSGTGLLDGKAGGRVANTLPYAVGTVLLAPTNGPGGAYLNTVYFRTHFDSFGSGTGTITFQTVLDDAGVIYLNGVEISRIRMNAGTVIYSTFGNASVADAIVEGPFTVTVTNLLAGDNVIAVEVHQNATGSSDITWGGEFSVFIPSSGLLTNQPPGCTNISFTPPALSFQRANGTNVILSWTHPVTNSCGSNAVFTLQQALSLTNPPSSTVWSDVTTVSPYTAVGTNKSRFFRLRR